MSTRAERRTTAGVGVFVAILSGIVLVESTAANAVTPLLPLFLAGEGASDGLVGVVMAAFFAGSLIAYYPAGRQADRRGRRAVFLGGLIVETAGTLALALPVAPAAYAGLRAFQGIGAGASEIAAAALVAASVEQRRRGRAFSVLFGAEMAGTAIGPAAGAALGARSMTMLFLVSGAVLLAATIVAVAAFRRTAPRVRADAVADAADPASPLRLRANAVVLSILVLSAGAGLLTGLYEAVWTLLLDARGATATQIGLSWTLFAAPLLIMALPAGWLADHADRRLLAAAPLCSSAILAALFPFLHSVPMLIGLGALDAVGLALAYPAAQSLLTEAVPADALGRAEGAATTAETAGVVVCAAISGSLFAIDPRIPFILGGALAFVSALALMVVLRRVPGRATAAVDTAAAHEALPR